MGTTKTCFNSLFLSGYILTVNKIEICLLVVWKMTLAWCCYLHVTDRLLRSTKIYVKHKLYVTKQILTLILEMEHFPNQIQCEV